MNLKEFLNEEQQVLNEGIKYSKESLKIQKLVNKLEYQTLVHITDQEQRKEVKNFIDKAKTAVGDFSRAEKEFATGNKRTARVMHKKMKQNYAGILARVDKPLLNIFKQYGSSVLYYALIQAFSLFLLPNMLKIKAPIPSLKV